MFRHIAGIQSRSVVLTEITGKQVQPNAIDLRIDRVFSIHYGIFELSEDHKKHRPTEELLPEKDWDGNEVFKLAKDQAYEVLFKEHVVIGDDELGWIVPRSTLVRNGLFVVSGLYDTGFNGIAGCCIHNTIGPAHIRRGTRIAQFVLTDAESMHSYDGAYGVGKEDTTKYKGPLQ